MCHLQHKIKNEFGFSKKYYSLKKGLNTFGLKVKNASKREMTQLHERTVFTPIKIQDLNKKEKARAMESLIILVQKQDGSRAFANGSTQRKYISKEDATSPTVSTEAVMVTGVIEAKQGREILTADIANACVQTNIKYEKGQERISMKIKGPLIDILVEIIPETYTNTL